MRTRGGRGSKIPRILRTSFMNGPLPAADAEEAVALMTRRIRVIIGGGERANCLPAANRETRWFCLLPSFLPFWHPKDDCSAVRSLAPEKQPPVPNASFSYIGICSDILCASTELRKFLCTSLRECCRQVEAEVISNSWNKLHQTWYKEISSPQYTQYQPLASKANNTFALTLHVLLKQTARRKFLSHALGKIA